MLACVLLVTLLVGALSAAIAPDAQTGEIGGRITITKALTKKRVNAAPYELRGVTVPSDSRVASAPGDEMSRVVVYLEGSQLKASKAITVELNQRDRHFEPEMVVIPVGSTVSFPNRDPIFHNVFSLSKLKAFDLGNYPLDQTRTIVFEKPGIVQVFCHLHPNMNAAIVVTPNQWYTRPWVDGTFSLRSVPPGPYELVVWHKSAGFFRRQIEVQEGKLESINLEIPIREAPPTS